MEETWSELFLLCAVQWCLPLDATSPSSPSGGVHPLFDVNEHLACSPSLKGNLPLINAVRQLQEILCKFRSVCVDPAEFACLKAIILFRAEARGLKVNSLMYIHLYSRRMEFPIFLGSDRKGLKYWRVSKFMIEPKIHCEVELIREIRDRTLLQRVVTFALREMPGQVYRWGVFYRHIVKNTSNRNTRLQDLFISSKKKS